VVIRCFIKIETKLKVYMENIYDVNVEFHSFRKVAQQMGHPYSKIEMGTIFSISKGYMGE
jgi:alanine transaminase